MNQRQPRLEIPKILKAARGQNCTIQHPTFCTGGTETTVAAHANWLATGKGFGMKADDLSVAWSCAGCHSYLDRTRDPDRVFYFLRGHLKTLRLLWEQGVIK